MSEGGQRRSARISALEQASASVSKKNKDPTTAAAAAHNQQAEGGEAEEVPCDETAKAPADNVGPIPYQRKKVRKRKRLDEVASTSIASTTQQDGEESEKENPPISEDEPENLPSLSWMPQKRILEFVLDVLQRRDTHDLFGHPVDVEEVAGYDEIIHEPMDFGTIRAKLQEDMYTALEEFEKDVFLVSSNAMEFNSSTTIYFRQARAINDLAKRVFRTLRTNPTEIEQEFSLEKGRRGRKPQNQYESLSSKRSTNPRVNVRACRGSVNSDRSAKEGGSRGGRDMNSCERRLTCKPWTSLLGENELIASTISYGPKQFHSVHGAARYRESLLGFVKDLGPAAQKFADRKLAMVSPNLSSYAQMEPTWAGNNNIMDNQGPCTLQNLLGDSITTTSSNVAFKQKIAPNFDNLDIFSGTWGAKVASPNVGASNIDSASKGKNVITDDIVTNNTNGVACGRKLNTPGIERLNIGGSNRLPLGGNNAFLGEVAASQTGLMGHCYMSQYNNNQMSLNSIAAKMEGFLSPAFGVTDTSRKYRTDLHQQSVTENVPPPNLNNQLGLHLSSAGNMNLTGLAAAMADSYSKYLSNQVQPAPIASELQSGLLDLMSRNRNSPKPSVLPSKVITPSRFGQTSSTLWPGSISQQSQCAPYLASSAQASQPAERSRITPWGSHAFYDFPEIPSHLQQGPQSFVTYMDRQQTPVENIQTLPNDMASLGRDLFGQEELQMALAPYMQNNETTTLHPNIYMHQQGQNSWNHHQPSYSYVEPQVNNANPLGLDAFLQAQQTGQMFGAGNIVHAGSSSSQNQQAGNFSPQWNYGKQSPMGRIYPDLELQLGTRPPSPPAL